VGIEHSFWKAVGTAEAPQQGFSIATISNDLKPFILNSHQKSLEKQANPNLLPKIGTKQYWS